MKHAAVIIETRDLPNLCQVIDNHLSFLPKDWELVVFGSLLNFEHLKKNYPEMVFYDLEKVKLSNSEVNKLMTSKDFWNELSEYERVLIFQPDSKLLRHGIEEFLEYDYVGAPWKPSHIAIQGGNGGLSIRSPKAMLKVLEKVNYVEAAHGNEDLFFCIHLLTSGGYLAPNAVAKTFSVEQIFYPTPIGCHAPEKWLTQDELKQLLG